MKYEMEMHDGECGFCGTTVPMHASVCAGCGARWGSQSGNTPEEVHQTGKDNLKGGIILVVLSIAIAIGLFFLTSSLWAALALLTIAPFLGLCGVVTFLVGLIGIHAAKSLKIAWWRQQ